MLTDFILPSEIQPPSGQPPQKSITFPADNMQQLHSFALSPDTQTHKAGL